MGPLYLNAARKPRRRYLGAAGRLATVSASSDRPEHSSSRTMFMSRGASIPSRTVFGPIRTIVMATLSPMRIRSPGFLDSTSIVLPPRGVHLRFHALSESRRHLDETPPCPTMLIPIRHHPEWKSVGTRRAVSSSKLRARITSQARMSMQFYTFCRFPDGQPLTERSQETVELTQAAAASASLNVDLSTILPNQLPESIHSSLSQSPSGCRIEHPQDPEHLDNAARSR